MEIEKVVKDALVNSVSGQQLLDYLTDYCMVYKTTLNPMDTHATAFNEGVRSVALHLLMLAGKDAQTLNQDKLKKGSLNPWLNKLQNKQ